MRSISTMVTALGLAVLLLGANPTGAAEAPAPPQSAPTTPLGDCPAGAACGQTNAGWRIVEQRPGFWTLDQVPPESKAGLADPLPAAPQVAAAPAPTRDPSCTSYPLPVVVNGQTQQATVVACPQADGSWRVTQYSPGLPPQVYTEPAQPAAAASSDDYSSPGSSQSWDWAGVPWFYGFAPVIVRGREFGRFHHAAFRGLSHDFSREFAHRVGFGHGLAGVAVHGGAHPFFHNAAAGHIGVAVMRR
ncbi:MAG TPA: hypothetical protein VGR45_19180 [Stellaceae bacterium]|nr:hypothetical protein [Stellaceae bacterium]